MTLLLPRTRERTRFLRFVVVGSIGALVDFSTFNILTSFLGVNPVWASVFSFCTAILSNFMWNRYWTYPDSRSKMLFKQIIQFSIVSVLGLSIRTPLFAVLEGPLSDVYAKLPFLPIYILTPEFLGHNTALAIAIVVVMFWNFFVNRYWTYNDVD